MEIAKCIDSHLTKLFNSSSARVLDFLLTNPGFDYTELQLSEFSQVPTRTLQRIIPILLSEYLIKRKRKNSKNYFYSLNLDSEIARLFIQIINSKRMEKLDKFKYIKKPIIKMKIIQ